MDLPQKLVSWLQDAHAIEQNTEKSLQSYLKIAKGYPELAAKIEEHLVQTRRHAARLEQCLQGMGKAHSGLESMVGKILGMGQSAAANFLGDPILTGCAAAYTMEQLEVATYVPIIEAAQELGQAEVARISRENMAEDSAMAAWLLSHLPRLTRKYLGVAENTGQEKV